MIQVAITGGICCGKTTACRFIEKLGFEVFYSDDIAISLAEKNKELKDKIIKEFGLESYTDEKYNRKYIASIVFNDSDKLKILNQIFVPFIDDAFVKFRNGKELVFYESAIIFEHGRQNEFDFIICCYAPKDVVIDRLKTRNKLTNDEIMQRLNNQISSEVKKDKSNYAIDTSENIIDVELEVIRIINLIRCGGEN